jgi:hypothetical protein
MLRKTSASFRSPMKVIKIFFVNTFRMSHEIRDLFNICFFN